MANSSGSTTGGVGALAWHAAAPGSVARPRARRRAIVRRSEGKQGVKRAWEGALLLCNAQEMCKGEERWCRGPAATLSSARWRSTGNGAAAGCFRAPGSHGRLQRRATNPGERSARPEDHRQHEIAVAAELTCGEISGKFPTQAGVWIEAECSGRSLGMRQSCGATQGRLRCGGAVWPRRRRGLFVAELCERGGLGFGAAL